MKFFCSSSFFFCSFFIPRATGSSGVGEPGLDEVVVDQTGRTAFGAGSIATVEGVDSARMVGLLGSAEIAENAVLERFPQAAGNVIL